MTLAEAASVASRGQGKAVRAWQGQAWLGKAVRVCLGTAWLGKAGRSWRGVFRHGMDWLGVARFGEAVKARRGAAWRDVAWRSCRVLDCCGKSSVNHQLKRKDAE